MEARDSYTYSMLKYVHDAATGEFVNVGVALYCQNKNYFNVILRTTVGRVAGLFPDVQADAFMVLMERLSNRFKDINEAYSSPIGFCGKHDNLEEILRSVTPKDDSAIVWSKASFGLTNHPQETLEKLYARYVSKHDKICPAEGRDQHAH
nr:DUF3037 domain-containing protein [Ferrovum sp.]